MLSRKQVSVIILSIAGIVTVTGTPAISEKRELIRQFSHVAVDKSTNSLKISEMGYNVRELSDQGLAQPEAGNNDDFIELLEGSYDDNEIHHLDKREAEYETENFGDEKDPLMDDVQGIWQGMWQTMVEGAKQIVKKVAERFDHEAPPQNQGAEM